MYLPFSLFAFWMLLPFGLLAQSGIGVEVGLQHLRMLDRHASPVVYQATALNYGMVFRKEKTKSSFSARGNLMISQLEPANPDLFRYDFGGSKNSIVAGLAIDYLRRSSAESKLWWGASISYNAMIDFEGVANFPWATLYGDLGLKVRKDLRIGNNLKLQGELGVPVIGLVTRQPFNFIPREEGEEPGVASLLALGTKVATWNKYQRVDLRISGSIQLGERWKLQPAYRFHWFRYAEPKAVRLYRQTLFLSLVHQL